MSEKGLGVRGKVWLGGGDVTLCKSGGAVDFGSWDVGWKMCYDKVDDKFYV